MNKFKLILIAISCIFISSCNTPESIPHLEKHGMATRLIVHEKPYIMIAGEIHNSSSSNLEYMEKVWPKLQKLNLNTVLLPISWELFEPEEGKYDYALVDGLIRQARENDMKLVFLWFASWKNGVSDYVPDWVKKNTARFPRAKGTNNYTMLVLSTFSETNRDADAKAFAALMRRIREIDSKENTVIMVQVQNEIGIKPPIRDMSEEANRRFSENVPGQLMDYMKQNKDKVHSEILSRWEKSGFATSGTWSEVFGGSPEADEIFSTWYYALYVQHIIEKGKAEYPLPMFVNAWLINYPLSGTYPSGGPVAHVMDVWRAAAPAVDIYAPDIYQPDFKGICAEYSNSRNENPLLIPEAHRDEDAAGRAYWTFGKHHGICFALFGIESVPDDHPIADVHALLKQSAHMIGMAQGTSRMTAVYEQEKMSPADDQNEQPFREETIVFGDWNIAVKYSDDGLQPNAKPGALIIQSEESDEEFYIIGQGVELTFSSRKSKSCRVEILSIDIGRFEGGQFISELRANGDEGRIKIPVSVKNIFLDPSKPRILRVRLYQFD